MKSAILAVWVRGRSKTTWTRFWPFDKKKHFLTTYPPHLVHVVFERPLSTIFRAVDSVSNPVVLLSALFPLFWTPTYIGLILVHLFYKIIAWKRNFSNEIIEFWCFYFYTFSWFSWKECFTISIKNSHWDQFFSRDPVEFWTFIMNQSGMSFQSFEQS